MQEGHGRTEAARRDVTETVEYRGQTSPAELSFRDHAEGESAPGKSWRDTPPSRPSRRAAGRGDRSRGTGPGGGGRAGARAPAQRPPSRFPAQHGGTGGGKRLPQRARGGLRGARRSPRGVPRPPGRIGRSLRPEARRSPAGEVPGPALRRRGDATPRGPPVCRSEPADPLSGRSPGVLRRHPEHGRGDGAAAGCDRSLHGDRGPEDGQRGSRPPPGGPPRGARQRLLAPRPDGRGVHPEARRGAGPRNGNPVAQGACPRRAAPAVGGTARRQRGDLRLLPSRLPGPVHGRPGRPRSRDPGLGRAGVRSLGDLPGPRDRGRRHGAALARRGACRAPHRPHPPGRGRRRPSRRSRSRPGSSCSTGGSSERWGIAEERLPAGSVVLFREKTLWSEHRGKVLGGIAVLLAQALLIGTLLVERRSRIAAQAGLGEAERRYRTVADFTHDWEYWRRPDGSFAYVSPSCRRTTGYEAAEFERRPALLDEIVLEEDRAAWREHDEEAQGGAGAVAARVPHPGGGRAGALDGPRLLARDGRGRDVPGRARVEPGRDREEAVGGAAAQRPGRDPAAARAARGRQHLPAGAGGAGAGLREDHRHAATSCATSSPASSRWRPRRARSSSRARRASARSSSPTRSTTSAPAGTGPSSSSTARRCRPRSSRASSSGTRRALSPAPSPSARAASRSPTAPPSSSTRSASCPSSCRPSSCG